MPSHPISATPGSHRGAGRFAPSPTGDLHLGNPRTALLAWLLARSSGREFLVRVEDLDADRSGSPDRQLADLATLGLTWDRPVLRQSTRGPAYEQAIDRLAGAGLVYECWCTRREIQQAPSAPHTPPGAYPGTCRELTEAQQQQRRAAGRPAALRLRAEVNTFTVTDRFAGRYMGAVDDFVLRRGDGTVAYNLAVVVDDAAQGIDQVVRGDDLLPSSPRQAYLAGLLGLPEVQYAHVPLVLNPAGTRLAKRNAAVTLADLADRGVGPAEVLRVLADSLGPAVGPSGAASVATDLLAGFTPDRLPHIPWVVDSRVLPG